MTLKNFAINDFKERDGERLTVFHQVKKRSTETGKVTESAIYTGRAISVPAPYKGNKTILFDNAAYNIDNEDKAALAPVIQYLMKHPETNISLEGHTDTRGSVDYNQTLSENRANATRDYIVGELKKQGLSDTDISNRVQIHTQATGENNLIKNTPDNTAMPENRAVEVHFHYDVHKVAKIKNIEHLYLINKDSPNKIAVSSDITQYRKNHLESTQTDYLLIHGQSSLIINTDVNPSLEIEYDIKHPESVKNTRFLLKDDGTTKAARFQRDEMNSRIHIEVEQSNGMKKTLTSIHIPSGIELNQIELGILDQNGHVHKAHLNEPMNLTAVDYGTEKNTYRDLLSRQNLCIEKMREEVPTQATCMNDAPRPRIAAPQIQEAQKRKEQPLISV